MSTKPDNEMPTGLCLYKLGASYYIAFSSAFQFIKYMFYGERVLQRQDRLKSMEVTMQFWMVA